MSKTISALWWGFKLPKFDIMTEDIPLVVILNATTSLIHISTRQFFPTQRSIVVLQPYIGRVIDNKAFL